MELVEILVKLISSLGNIVLVPFRFLLGVDYKKLLTTFPTKKIKPLHKRLSKQLKKEIKYIKKKLVLKKPKKVRKKLKKRKVETPYKLKYFIFGVLFTIIFVLIPLVGFSWFRDLPNPRLLSQVSNRSTKILDRNGKLLYEIYLDKKYEPVRLDEIPEHVVDATLAIEDSDFYSHRGIKLSSMLRAARVTLFEGKLQGGSTITQQLVKNVLLTPERTVSRKLKEVAISLMVENIYTKDEILELYLNNISYGGTAWGIQSASHKFFDKDVWELDLAEAAFLAGLPTAPSAYSPFIAGPEISKNRQRVVLDRMVELDYISSKEANSAFDKKLVLASQAEFIRAPHFVNYVRNQLEEMYGTRYVTLGGLTVTTTLDLDLQGQVQEIVRQEVENNTFYGFTNSAATVLAVDSREILAYVGSKNYFAEDIDGKFDVVTAYRQPGSSVKPITYALAFKNKLTPGTVIDDSPVSINTIQGVYTPKNYDGKYHGNVSLRQALANSYNIPAVKLAQRLGSDNIVDLGKRLGLSNWEVDGSYGVSITLGGKEVRLLDHTNVFASFGDKGKYNETSGILTVQNANGFDIYKDQRSKKQVISEEIAYLVTHILSDNNARVPAFGYYSSLVIPNHPVAVKTGTTDSIRDNWTLGYTPDYAVGAWVGNNNNTPMHPTLSSGLTGAAPIWNRIMHVLLDNTQPQPFEKPKGVFVKTDKKCGISEVFIKGSFIPESLCSEPEEEEETKEDD